jgi:hypothetical protein
MLSGGSAFAQPCLFDAIFVALSVCCDFCGYGFLVILCGCCLGEYCADECFVPKLRVRFARRSSLFYISLYLTLALSEQYLNPVAGQNDELGLFDSH